MCSLEWQAGALRFKWDRWTLTWETRFLDEVKQDGVEAIDEFDSISGGSDTCLGPPADVLRRDYAEADNYFRHSTSLFYKADTILGAGIRNVFNKHLAGELMGQK